MRILHFQNIPLSIDEIRSGGQEMNTSGGWMAAILGRMLKETDFKFACAAFGGTKTVQISRDDRIDCFIIPKGKHDSGSPLERSLRMCRDLVNEWKPDLIHINGTEGPYGLLTARGLVKCPTVISLQGLLGPCSEWYHYFGNRSLSDVIRMHRWLEIPAMRGHCWAYWNIRKRAKREREIIRGNRFFMGRTAWDCAYLRAINPSAAYYQEERMLREAFWYKRWCLDESRRHRIIFTNVGHPRKGTEILLDAVKLLKHDYPGIQAAFAGTISRRSGYGRYIRRRIDELGDATIELGPLNAGQMADELAKSHIFVSPSYIDNSPNAVCEAQLVGMPVVSTYTGGVPSLIEDGVTGLFFPTGDAPMLAARLREVFEDDGLAVRLGSQAQNVACKRHNSNSIVQQVLKIYEDVLSETV